MDKSHISSFRYYVFDQAPASQDIEMGREVGAGKEKHKVGEEKQLRTQLTLYPAAIFEKILNLAQRRIEPYIAFE